MSNEPRLAELIAEITAAFDGVGREDGTTLHEAIIIDDGKSAKEQLAARRLDKEHRWQDVPAESITASSGVPCFLDAKGFRYYLPVGLKNGDLVALAV